MDDAVAAGGRVDPELARQVEVENRIRAAYRAIRSQPGQPEWVGLADLRDEVGDDIPRAELDRVLVEMARGGGWANRESGFRMIPVANSKALQDRDRSAAVMMGGEPSHAISFRDPSDRPMPSPTPARRTAAERMRDAVAAGAVVGRDRERALDVAAGRPARAPQDERIRAITDAVMAGEMTPGEAAQALGATGTGGDGLSDKQRQLLLRADATVSGRRIAVEDTKDPEIEQLRARGLIKVFGLKGQVQITGRGRREAKQLRDAAGAPGGGPATPKPAKERVDARELAEGLDVGPGMLDLVQRALDGEPIGGTGKNSTPRQIADVVDQHARSQSDSTAIRFGNWDGQTILGGERDPEDREQMRRDWEAGMARVQAYKDLAERLRAVRRRSTAAPARKSAARKMAVPKAESDAHVAAIRGLTTSEDVGAYLDAHPMTAAQMREVARGLGPTVAVTGRTKPDIRRAIIDGTTGFRERTEVVLPGGWRGVSSQPEVPSDRPLPAPTAPAPRSAVERMTGTRGRGPDPRDVATQVASQTSEADMIRLLAGDQQLTAARLLKVADELGIDVPEGMRAKTALQMHIADAVARRQGLPRIAAGSPAVERMTGRGGGRARGGYANPAEARERLMAATSIDEGWAYLNGLDLNVTQIRKLAADLGVRGTGRMPADEVKNAIVRMLVGSRLDMAVLSNYDLFR
jgi:hypothetical protein